MKRYRGANLRHGLVGAWCPSVAGNGLLLPDLSDYGNHGTLTNMDASDWVGTDRGRALDFDGSDDFVRVSSAIIASGSFSVSVWFKADGFSATANLWSRGRASDGTYMAVRISTAGVLFFSVDGVFTTHSGTTTLNTSEFYHICFVHVPPTTSTLFLNTRQEATGNSTSNYIADNNTIGSTPISSGAQFFDGQIADVRVYNRALSSSEIKQLYEGGPGYGLRQERKRTRFEVQGFNAGRYRRQQLIGTGVY
jgi:hypothetical protein